MIQKQEVIRDDVGTCKVSAISLKARSLQRVSVTHSISILFFFLFLGGLGLLWVGVVLKLEGGRLIWKRRADEMSLIKL
ncbi:uncharacterized protein J3R85_015165 [Psidium guajava]|nr:uncharacterized protein J3R85_015165 [Psidium guajava]